MKIKFDCSLNEKEIASLNSLVRLSISSLGSVFGSFSNDFEPFLKYRARKDLILMFLDNSGDRKLLTLHTEQIEIPHAVDQGYIKCEINSVSSDHYCLSGRPYGDNIERYFQFFLKESLIVESVYIYGNVQDDKISTIDLDVKREDWGYDEEPKVDF